MINEVQNSEKGSEQTINNNFTSTTLSNESSEKNEKVNLKKIVLILIIVALLLIGTGVGYLFYLNTNPVKVYQTAITKVVDDVFKGLYQDYDKTNTTVKLSAKVNVTEGLFDQEIIDYINKTSILLNAQFDNSKQQMVVKIDSNHDNESLIDIAMFLNAKDEKMYLYAKDYFNKYLEVEMDDYTTFKELFEELEMTNAQKANANRAKKIIKKEISKLITKDDCYKKDGAFVFEITDKELANKLKILITNLKDNKSFLECFEDSDEIKTLLESTINNYEGNLPIDDTSSEKMTITLNKGLFTMGFDKLTAELSGIKVLLENQDKQVTYKIYSNDVVMFDGYIKTTKEKNTEKLELSANLATVGNVTLYMDTTVLKNSKIETVDSSKTVKLEDLSEDEMSEIMTKIEDSPLYEIISSLEFGDDYEDDYVSDCTGMLQYNGGFIKLNLPSNFTVSYCTNNYASYYIDDVDVDYSVMIYDSYNEYFEEVKDDLKYQDGKTEYQNKVLTDIKTKTINGRTYYYIDYTYDYVSMYTSNVYEKYICTKLKDGIYLSIEIESWDEKITDSIVNSVLNIN